MPRDLNQLARKTLLIATGEDVAPEPAPTGKDPLAVELGRRGGLKGGKARWKGVSQEERRRITSKAARARWKKR